MGLHLAVISGSRLMCEFMIERGASVFLLDELGRSALSLAIKSNFNIIASVLVKAGASLSDEEMNSFEDTWFISAEEGNVKSITSLLLGKFDFMRTNEDGLTALMLAAKNGHKQVIEALIEAGASVDKQEVETGNTALHYACINNQPEAIDALCDANATRHIKNKEDQTPFDVAIEYGNEDCGQRLTARAKAPVTPKAESRKSSKSQKRGPRRSLLEKKKVALVDVASVGSRGGDDLGD